MLPASLPPPPPPLPKLRAELDSFDPSFFEEVEDLKFNYQEEVKKNIQYEQQITCLLGVAPLLSLFCHTNHLTFLFFNEPDYVQS